MVLADNRITKSMTKADLLQLGALAGAVHIYDGALLNIATDSGGYAEKATDAANKAFLGVSQTELDQAAGVAADTNPISYKSKGSGEVIEIPIVTGVDYTKIDTKVYIVDDEKVDLVGGVTNNVEVGVITYIVSANIVGVRI